MRTLALLFLGGVAGWAASGVDWSRDAVGQVTDSITGKPINSYDGDGSLDLKGAPMSNVSIDFYQARSAAPESPSLVDRFQASAYGSPNGHGCYIVDTMTGKAWHVANGQRPQVVVEALIQPVASYAMPLPTATYVPPMLSQPVEPTPNEPLSDTAPDNIVEPAEPAPRKGELTPVPGAPIINIAPPMRSEPINPTPSRN